jgi:hypothetical protein
MNDDKLTWLNGWSVKDIDTAIHWRQKRLKNSDIDKIINTRKIPIRLIRLINAIELTNIIK